MFMKKIKELGQHFLNDPSIAHDIVESAKISADDRVWEIGPGEGVLTSELLQKSSNIRAFEIDKRLETGLRERFGKSLDLHITDILRVDWDTEIGEQKNIKLVSNIPYQITSPLLYKLEKHADAFSCIVMMIQKEVADRLTAKPGTKDYGQITVRLCLLFDIETVFYVSKEYFDPPPKVDSAVIKMQPRVDRAVIKNPQMFFRLLTAAFAHRRKTLRNNLSPILNKDQRTAFDNISPIDLSRRGETLSEAEFILLADALSML